MLPHSPASRVAWQGRSWRLRVDKLHLPDGSSVEKGIIEHPGSVVLVPLRDTEAGPEVLMLRQYRLALDRYILELPAGTQELAEEPLTCARRELREETGYRADYFEELGWCWPTPGLSNEIMTIYLAASLHSDPLPKDNDEIIEVQPFLLKELIEMALDGRLLDAKSIVGILRTERFLRESHKKPFLRRG